jgi:competence protein ComEC
MGVQRLSGIIVSHFDSDHYNATDRLVEKYPTGCLVSSDPRVHAWCRQTGGFPKSTMSIVPPNPDWPIANLGRLVAGTEHGGDNERSLALFGAQGEHTFCLTGDLEGEGLEGLLSSPIDELDVLLVPHHGSLHSQPARVAEWARPHWAIISGGWQDRRPEVLAAYERVGATVLHTHDGAIRVVLKPGTEPKVTQWRQGKWRKSLDVHSR